MVLIGVGRRCESSEVWCEQAAEMHAAALRLTSGLLLLRVRCALKGQQSWG